MDEKPGNMTVAEMGRRGGFARARNLSKRRRHDQARKAARARWGKKRKKK